jgi:hypothetical protein
MLDNADLIVTARVGYYPHIGMERHESCWVIRAQET